MNISIGETVRIRHRSTGEGKLTPSESIFQEVAAIYMDGRIKTTSGDVWRVVRNSSELMTVE